MLGKPNLWRLSSARRDGADSRPRDDMDPCANHPDDRAVAAARAAALLDAHAPPTGPPTRMLASAWRTWGNALRDRGEPGDLARAMAAYDAAIALGSALAGSGAGALRDDLASSWTNRGIALLQVGSAESLREAIRAFDEAIHLRRSLP